MLAQSLFVAVCPLLVMQSSAESETDARTEGVASSKAPDVEAVLEEWQRREPQIERARVHFTQYAYDDVFAVEERSKGVLHFEPREKYSWSLKPADVDEGTLSGRNTDSGRPFTLAAEKAMLIYVDGRGVTIAEPDQMTYTTGEYPPNIRQWAWETLPPEDESPSAFWENTFASIAFPSWIDLRSSLLTGTNVKQLREVFEWSHRDTTNRNLISLSAVPIDAKQARSIRRIDVLLDPDSYRTRGVRFIGVGGSKSTVLVPNDVQFNDTVERVRPPDLQGYTRWTPPKQGLFRFSQRRGNQGWTRVGSEIMTGVMLLFVLIL